MNERSALILGSAVAAWCVSNVAVVFAKLARWVRPGDFEYGVVQLKIAIPAMLAVSASAWWCTRKPYFNRNETLLLAMFITLLSYPFLCLSTFLVITVDGLMNSTFASHEFIENLLFAMMASGSAAMVGFVVTSLPAFVTECLVIRLVRSNPMRALLSGVGP